MPNNLPKFRELGLSENMIATLNKKGFEEPTEIQKMTIPLLLRGEKDVVGKAKTGSGKTGAFGIPPIENITPNSGAIKAIIMAPTRELAVQVTEELSSLFGNKKLKIISIYGGQPIERQISALRHGVDIVVGTPGRILDHLQRKTLDISKVEYVILDEADEMLNMGFIDDIETILKSTPREKRMLLFSATMPENILRLAKKYMREYEFIEVKEDHLNKNNIEQIYFEVSNSDKFEALYRIIDVEKDFYGMIFCRTKIDTDDIGNKLNNRGCAAEVLHGDISQGQREKILRKFKNKKANILVATDVAARGIDVDNLTHVINYSLPQDPESYIHRIGRTGRAGKSGTAITLITPSEYRKLLNIQKIAKATIVKQKVPGVSEVIASKKSRIKKSVDEIIASKEFKDFEEIAADILAQTDASTAVSALLKYAFKGELNASNYNEITDASAYKKNKDYYYDDRGMSGYVNIGEQGRRGYVDRKGTARLFVAKGRNDGMNPRNLAEFIEKETGVYASKIDDIKILDAFSFIAVPFEDAERILKSFQVNAGGGRSLVSHAKQNNDRPNKDRPNRDRFNKNRR